MAPSLQQKRGYLRADITRVLNNITDAPDTFDETNCTATIARLTNLNDDLRKHNDTILNGILAAKTDPDDNSDIDEYDSQIEYENKFYLCISRLQSRLASLTNTGAAPSNAPISTASTATN